MKTKQYNALIDSLDSLNTIQFRKLKSNIQKIEDKEPAIKVLESNYSDISCPHCKKNSIKRWGKRNGLQRYRCKCCQRTFNSLTGTPLARLHKKEQWIKYSECLKEGVSIRKSAVKCEIHRNTAFNWRHRFLLNINQVKAENLNGIVEADETYFLKSEKGSKKLTRKARKRGGKASQRGLSKEQVCVFVSRDRNGNTYDNIFETFNTSNLEKVLNRILSKDALFCSDSKPVYKSYTRQNNVRHGFINLSKGERVKKDIVHIQNVNSYHSRVKKWMIRFNVVATKYLQNYLSWFRVLDEFNMETLPELLLLRAKQGGKYGQNYVSNLKI
ncbi:MAG: IS1595 family transposase [bacterium]|nr:IS1595 family transposase [bacterium]